MPKPDFTGTWIFNPGKSVLQISPPESTVFLIDHREPIFRLSRTHVFQGRSDILTLNLTTDGEEVEGQHRGLHFQCRGTWDGEALVFEMKIAQGENSGTNTVRYTLSGNADMLVAEERLRSTTLNYDNRWVMDKQP